MVEFSPATREARVRFPDVASFTFFQHLKVIRVIFFASLLGGEREKKLLDTEVVDTTPCSIASSTTSSVVTIPDEFSRTRRANSMAAVGNQIYEIIRGHRSADERLIKGFVHHKFQGQMESKCLFLVKFLQIDEHA